MSANQLLSKALSTDSEDEAIACLKMARKKGLKLEEDISKGYKASLEISHLKSRLRATRVRLYSLEAWLILAAVAVALELVVIIIMSNYG
jgi:hypothetical protein